MPKVTAKQTVTTEVTIKPTVKAKILAWCRAYQGDAAWKKSSSARMDEAREAVLNIGLEHINESKFEVDGYKIALVTDAETSKLDQIKLMKLIMSKTDFSLEVIQDWFDRCTKRTPTKPYSKITCPDDKEVA